MKPGKANPGRPRHRAASTRPTPPDGAKGKPPVWERYWHLTRAPFLAPGSPYVSTAGHDEAVARLVDAIERAHRLAVVRGDEGLGKSTVVARAAAETRGPLRKFATVHGPTDAPALHSGLAEGLGVPVGA